MVDVSEKPETVRLARAACRIRMGAEAAAELRNPDTRKGDVLAAARLAGIQAAKRTSDLIPLCHPVRTTRVQVDLTFEDERTVSVEAEATAVDRTGVEMEAMTAASVAALTLYDMLKGVDRSLIVTDLRLLEKRGGRSGHWTRDPEPGAEGAA